jgi:AraC family transcriptional regulator
MEMPQTNHASAEGRSPRTSWITGLDNAAGHYLFSAKAMLENDPKNARVLLDRLAMLLSGTEDAKQNEASTLAQNVVTFIHSGGLAKWQWSKVQNFIEVNLAETIHVQTLASLVHLSGGYFSRAFKVSTGDTPHNYITSQRLRRAQVLMLTTDEPLSEIALMCGFTDQAHMTRHFAQRVCQTPFVWRRNFKAA